MNKLHTVERLINGEWRKVTYEVAVTPENNVIRLTDNDQVRFFFSS